MTRYTFNFYYDPKSDKGNPFRFLKTEDQAAAALCDFPGVLSHVLRAVDNVATVSASPELAANGRIPIVVTTNLTEQQLYNLTKEQLNYLDLYGDPIRQLD